MASFYRRLSALRLDAMRLYGVRREHVGLARCAEHCRSPGRRRALQAVIIDGVGNDLLAISGLILARCWRDEIYKVYNGRFIFIVGKICMFCEILRARVVV